MTGPRLKKPYFVCDTCGHLWTVWDNPPVACVNCSHDALRAFPDVTTAVVQSRLVRGRL